MKLFIRIFIAFATMQMLIVSCARMAAPQGGPRDSLPPVVIRTIPAPYSTNFKGKKVTIEFNEFIQLKNQSKLFFVSPPGAKKPKLVQKGKSIEVQFDEALDSATTYRLDFGSSIVDNNEGNALHGYSYVFSTGNHIDSLVMAGQTQGAYERDTVNGAYIFFFDTKSDSQTKDSTMFNGKVEALFRTDSSGYFIADILKDKDYRIYALDDTNGNQKYEAGVDRIAFLDTVYNPTKLEPFTMTYDSVRRYMIIDPVQVNLELFKEIPIKRQSVSKQERPLRQKIVTIFNSAFPVIDSLTLSGINPDWIIREDGFVGDTVTFWIAPPTKEDVTALQDTIRGTMLLERQDSVWRHYMSKEKLLLTHKIVLTQEQLKEQAKEQRQQQQEVKRAERIRKTKNKTKEPVKNNYANTPIADTLPHQPVKGNVKDSTDKKKEEKKLNPFRFTTQAEAPLNPKKNIVFEFDYPLRNIDSSRIELYHIEKIRGKGKDAKEETRTNAIPFTLSQTPGQMRRWVLKADWKDDNDYRLVIPSGVFQDITFESNDTLKSDFKIANADKYGALELKTLADTTDKNSYIFEVVQKAAKDYTLVYRAKDIKAGQTLSVKYLKPGKYLLRIIQDKNHNGKWDTGSLVERRQPEKVRMLTDDNKQARSMISKERWTVEELIDLKKIFR